MTAHAATKQLPLALRSKSAGAPSAEQLAAINGFTLADLTADQLYVREFIVCHNGIDRDREVFDEKLLEQMATTLPGKGLFVKHPSGWDGDSGPGEGKWFAARVERMSFDTARLALREPGLKFPSDRTEAVLLMASAFIAKTPENEALRTKIDAGVASFISIGFGSGGPTDIVDANTGAVVAKRLNAPGEAYEASLVWLGCQPGARAVKAAPKPTEGSTTMDETQIKALQTANTDLDTKLKAAAPAIALATAVALALGEAHKELATDGKALAELAIAGKAARTQCIDDIVQAERVKKLIGDTPEEVAAAKSAYDAMPTERLLKLRALLGKGVDTAPAQAPATGLKPGDPNGGKPAVDDDASTKAFAGTALGCPLLG